MPVNGAQAITQSIDQPFSVISNATGGFYFARVGRVYRVAADGTLAVIAGGGTQGFFRDGGPAFSAQLASLASRLGRGWQSLHCGDNRTDFRTNLWINNPGTTTAHVTVRLMDKSGMRLGSLVTIVPPGGMTQLDRINLSLGFALPGAGLEGTLQLESDQDIIAWTSQIRISAFSFASSRSVQSTKLLVPSTTSTGGFRSSLVIANLAGFPTAIELTFRDVAGNVAFRELEVIPANGVWSSADVVGAFGVPVSYGPLEVNSSAPLLAWSRLYSPQRTGGTFEGVP